MTPTSATASSRLRVAIVIPARFGSTRLPGKPLVDILGKPMVQHVYERACEVPDVDVVVVATDDQRVFDAVAAFGGLSVMTSPLHLSGTDRLAEVMTSVKADLYINLQGDEPLVRPADLHALALGMWRDPAVQIGTLYHRISIDEAKDPNQVKVVLADNGDALYFSRAPIPYVRDDSAAEYFKHVGVYAYRREVLAAYSRLQPPMLERAEKLEQLRLLAAGWRIRAFQVEPTGPGVDTPEGLAEVRVLMANDVAARRIQCEGANSLAGVRLVITDVDGVLTDGGIYYDPSGECIKRFHVRDGLGMRMLQACGVKVAVLSGRDSETLRKRVSDLGISLAMFGVKDKADACLALMKQAGATAQQTACIGDDSIDLPAFAVCGISFAVADAPLYVRHAATRTLALAGGQGAFRALADDILKAQGNEHVLATAMGYTSVMDAMSQ